MKSHSAAGLIAAAGLSERMGSFKPLNIYKGETYLDAVIRKISFCCSEIWVVTGFNSDLIENEIKQKHSGGKVRTVFNPAYESGMFSSLQRGIEKCSGQDFILYHFVDQPFLPERFYEEFMLEAGPEIDWLQPYYNGRGGHPLLLNRKSAALISNAPAGSNLRHIKREGELIIKEWNCAYPEILFDFDTPDDVERLGK